MYSVYLLADAPTDPTPILLRPINLKILNSSM